MGGGYHTAPFHFAPSLLVLLELDRTARAAASGEGLDGSDPPFDPLARSVGGGGTHPGYHTRYHTTPPPSGGSLPSYVSCGKAQRPTRATADQPRRGARCVTHSSRLSCRRGISAVAAWTWPGMFPQADPVAVLVRYHHPERVHAVRRPGTTSRRACRVPHRPIPHQHVRIWFARMGVSLGLRSRLPAWPLRRRRTARRSSSGEVHHPVKPIESPTPQWLTIPERGLYTAWRFSGASGPARLRRVCTRSRANC